MRVKKLRLQEGMNEVHLPQGSQVLSVVEKDSYAALYVTVPVDSEDLPAEAATFMAVPTDVDFVADETNSTFVGSVRKPGTFTWHVFRLASAPVDHEYASHIADANA